MSLLEEFKKFIDRGNALDLAVGLAVGSAFTAIVKSLVDDIVMPPVGLIIGDMDFSNFFLVLKPGADGTRSYHTIVEAANAGAVTLNYGRFFNNIISFIIIAFAFFVFVKVFNKIKEDAFAKDQRELEEAQPSTKKCSECYSDIPLLAKRCPLCTSYVET